jgi:hypothetical protein
MEEYKLTLNGFLEDIAAVEYGRVLALKPGKTKITASFKGLTAEKEICFIDSKIVNIRFGEKVFKLDDINVLQEMPLFADFDDGSSIDISKYAEWQSKDPEVAVVIEGMLFSKGIGATEITASYGEFSCSIEVIVEKSEN